MTSTTEEAGKIILIYDWSMRPSEYNAVLNAIDKMQEVTVITISQFWFEMASNLKNCDIHKSNNIDNFWDKFCHLVTNYNGDYPEIFANPHLLFQFRGIKQEMLKASTYGDIFSALLDLIKPSLVIFAHEAFTIERTLVRLARNQGIVTASFIHGGLGPKSAFQGACGDVDILWVWNKYDIDWMVSFEVARERLLEIGCVRYEEQYAKYIFQRKSAIAIKKNVAKSSIGIDANKPLITLLTAEINTGFAAPHADPIMHRAALKGFIELAKARPDLQFVIKSHPGYDYNELYKNMLDFKLPNLVFNEQLALDAVLDASDICIMINYCTTAGLESMFHHVPLLFLDNAIYPMPLWTDSLSGTAIVRIGTIPDLENAIDELLTNPTAKKNALLEADKLLQIFLGIDKTSANYRLLSSIEKCLNVENISNFKGLNNAIAFKEFLYSNSANKKMYLGELSEKHNINTLLYTLGYLAGNYGLGISSLSKIIKLFCVSADPAKQASLDRAYWHLLHVYIEGSNHRRSQGSFLNGLRILCLCIVNPNKFFLSPSHFKVSFFKFIINQMLGIKGVTWTKNMLSMIKR